MLASWKKSYDKPRQHIKKKRHHFANKGLSSQSCGFSSSHVWMWELDHEESESEVTQLCLTLCYPMDRSPPGSSVHEIFQARILEWVAISFSRGSSQPRSPASQAGALISEPPGKPTREAHQGSPSRNPWRKLSTKELMLLNCGVG